MPREQCTYSRGSWSECRDAAAPSAIRLVLLSSNAAASKWLLSVARSGKPSHPLMMWLWPVTPLMKSTGVGMLATTWWMSLRSNPLRAFRASASVSTCSSAASGESIRAAPTSEAARIDAAASAMASRVLVRSKSRRSSIPPRVLVWAQVMACREGHRVRKPR